MYIPSVLFFDWVLWGFILSFISGWSDKNFSIPRLLFGNFLCPTGNLKQFEYLYLIWCHHSILYRDQMRIQTFLIKISQSWSSIVTMFAVLIDVKIPPDCDEWSKGGQCYYKTIDKYLVCRNGSWILTIFSRGKDLMYTL